MKETLFELIQRPSLHYLLFIILTILSILIWRPKNSDAIWARAGVMFIGFIVVNSILICLTPNTWHYFFYSLEFSALYLLSIPVLIPLLKKKLRLEGPDESSMIFISIIYHPILLLLMMFLKWTYVTLNK